MDVPRSIAGFDAVTHSNKANGAGWLKTMVEELYATPSLPSSGSYTRLWLQSN
jgi:hypothetical protein